MNGDVYILGAGASFESGAPLMNNFLDVAEDLLRKEAFEDDDSEKIQLVFDLISELQIVHSKAQLDLNNIESLFGAIEMGIILGRLTSKSQDIVKYKEALTTLISKTLIKSMLFPFIIKPGYVHHPTFKSSDSYNHFTQLLKNEKNQKPSVLTFNYDLGLELGFHYNDVKINYRLDDDTSGLNLLKLHGSINWYTNASTLKGKIKYLSVEDVNNWIRNDYSRNRYIERNRYTFDIDKYLNLSGANEQQDIEAVIIPPTWNKTEYQGQLTRVWEAAADELSKAQNIYILGYSLPESDSFFRYLFALGTISKNRIRNIVVYNPESSGDTEARFRRLFGLSTESRFQYKPLKFSEAIQDIARSKGIEITNNSPKVWTV
ncbi:hypothetical protein [Sabulibacter ruber]|uniref:hypothetical protein n=1 Tax=Sabulibacter ruber TaxID=2811901 RepID=UPI001A9748E4|nr:hypothetical protein [Sabulibacter ruber]